MNLPRQTYAKGDRYYGPKAFRYERKRRKQDWWHVEHAEMQSFLAKLPDGLSVIDIPFGTGRFVPLYIEKNFKVHGLDVSRDMIEAAKQELGAQFDTCETYVGSAMELPFEDNQFDLLVSTRFLRDIILFADANRALGEFARVTRKYLIIQLGEAISGGRAVADDEIWHSTMSAEMNESILEAHRLTVIEKRLVKEDEAENSRIHHVLCQKQD